MKIAVRLPAAGETWWADHRSRQIFRLALNDEGRTWIEDSLQQVLVTRVGDEKRAEDGKCRRQLDVIGFDLGPLGT